MIQDNTRRRPAAEMQNNNAMVHVEMKRIVGEVTCGQKSGVEAVAQTRKTEISTLDRRYVITLDLSSISTTIFECTTYLYT